MADVVTLLRAANDWHDALLMVVEQLHADSGTIHVLQRDGCLHLQAATQGIPAVVLDLVRVVPVGKGMAGLAVARGEPVTACNIQTDASGDVRPGAKATGLEGAIVVPVMLDGRAVGALGIANRRQRVFSHEEQDLLMQLGTVLAERLEKSKSA